LTISVSEQPGLLISQQPLSADGESPTWLSPDELSEEEMRAYLVKRRDREAARGTYKVALYAVQFLYEHTLGRD
jgi:hypothetical protein